MDAVSNCPPAGERLMMQASPAGKFDVEVLVSDNGPGIAKDALRKIFDTFYTTEATGTGLGLSIARTIVESNGGRLLGGKSGRRRGGIFDSRCR